MINSENKTKHGLLVLTCQFFPPRPGHCDGLTDRPQQQNDQVEISRAGLGLAWGVANDPEASPAASTPKAREATPPRVRPRAPWLTEPPLSCGSPPTLGNGHGCEVLLLHQAGVCPPPLFHSPWPSDSPALPLGSHGLPGLVGPTRRSGLCRQGSHSSGSCCVPKA